ncbi:MAG: sugar ABC transporter permease [Rhodospirillales bacterium]|nr:sugar ABC transporter permease [Rhodospirillales bacterium]
MGVALAFVTPALVALGAILALPILYSTWLSLTEASLAAGKLETPFIGLGNYLRLFSDKAVGNALFNTLYFALVEVAGVVVLGLLTALLLNHPMARWGGFRVMLLLPWAIAPVANAVLWKWIYHSNYGILNTILLQLGIIERNVTWLGDAFQALNMILIVDIWKSTPFIAILLLAALQNIPQSLYRAARMDGAGPWQAFCHVTLPSLRTALAIAVILQTIWSLRTFDLIFVLTKGGPADGTVVMNFLAYRVTFNFLKFGYGSAIANLIFMTSLALAILYVRLVRQEPAR